MLSAVQEYSHIALTVGVAFGVLFISWVLMRTLFLPSIGCWLCYVSTLVGIFAILVIGLTMVGVSSLINHFLEEHKDVHAYWLSGGAVLLMFIGKGLLSARKKKPFQAIMKWFLKRSFKKRVGEVLPSRPHDSAERLAFRAVYDDAYADRSYGAVDGWGVRACCKRLIRIKHNTWR